MVQKVRGTNTLYHDLPCPFCGSAIRSGIGFRAGAIGQFSYRLGDKISWQGTTLRPTSRPPHGYLKTIGYFNCDNPGCDSWQDCFPAVQEALITIKEDMIAAVQVTQHKPEEHSFDITEPHGLV